MKRTFSSLFLFAVLVGCASKPIPPDQAIQRFSTQAYYQDKRTGKNQQITIDVVAQKNQKLRMDLKVILGIHVATAVMVQNKVQVAVHAERKYYEGQATPQALQRTLGMPLYPLIFHAMLYRQAFRGSGWNCTVQNGKVQSCLQSPSGMTIAWEDMDGATMVTANSKTFNLQWKIEPPENIEFKPRYFEVSVPDSYTKLNL